MLPSDRLVALITELSNAIGLSGDEAVVRSLIARRVRPLVDRLESDAMGNLYAYKGWERPGPKLMVAAHMDEVGLAVAHIDDGGQLRVKAIGGLDARVLPGARVLVGEARLPGVIGSKPIHLKRADRSKAPGIDDVYVDIGAKDGDDAKRHVHVGDPIAFATQAHRLGSNRLAGKALDDRVGCSLLVDLLHATFDTPLCAVFTVQEEIGLRGATAAAYTLAPDVALVLETTTCADFPDTDEHKHSTQLGRGPAITLMDAGLIAPPPWVGHLRACAERIAAPHQFKRTNFGGTDGGAIHRSRGGVPTGVVSVPGRYIHAPCAVVDLGDVEAAAQLVQEAVQTLPTVAEFSPSRPQ